MLAVSFPSRSDIVEIPLRMSKERCRLKEGAIRTHWNAVCLLKDLSRKITKILSSRNSMQHLDDVIFRLLVFGIGVFLHKIFFFMALYQIFVSMVTIFETEEVSDNPC